MNQDIIQQAINLIDKSNDILLLTHAKADCDGLGAALSAYIALSNLGKNVTTATNDPTPENLAFLPSISIVQNSLVASNDFIITLDVSRTPLSKIKYNLEDDNKVNIIITPKEGTFNKEDISFGEPETGKFDLIITLDTGNLEHLGPIYEKNSELFFETPIINIDHHASNTDFGQINLVDVVAPSTTEILFQVLKEMEKRYEKKIITEDVATLLLAGIITDTGSFQHANTSPKSMEVSAELLDLGARQQEIIKNIYKTKKLSTLKLWGTVLSNVKVDPIYRIVWSSITKNDLKESGASSDESEGIIDDLLSSAPGVEIVMLIKENDEGYVSVSMRSTTNSADVGTIASDMGGGGHVRAAGFKARDGRSLETVLSQVLEKVRTSQAERLNIHPEDIATLKTTEAKKRPPKVKKVTADKKDNVKEQNGKVTYLNFDELSKTKTKKKEESKEIKSDEKTEIDEKVVEKRKTERKKEIQKVETPPITKSKIKPKPKPEPKPVVEEIPEAPKVPTPPQPAIEPVITEPKPEPKPDIPE